VLLRRIARPLFTSWFVAEGVDALRHPSAHVAAAREGLVALHDDVRKVPALAGALDRALTSLSDRQLGIVVRVHGAAMLVAAGSLALGKAPRAAGTALAVLTAPIVITSLPAGKVRGNDAEAARRRTLWSSASALGGALIAAGDLAGRPGVVWRVQAAREAKAAAREG